MKMNSNGYIARFYKWSYDEQRLPDNLCDYFWWLVLAMILFVPLLPGTILVSVCGRFDDGEWDFRMDMGIRVMGLVFLVIACAAVTGVSIAVYTYPWVVLSIVLVAFAVGFIWYFKSANVREAVSEGLEIVFEKASATKNRYCPKIEWK